MAVIDIEQGEFFKLARFKGAVDSEIGEHGVAGIANHKTVFWLPRLAVVSLVAREQVTGRLFADVFKGDNIALIGTSVGMTEDTIVDLGFTLPCPNGDFTHTAEFIGNLDPQEAARELAEAHQSVREEQVETGRLALQQMVFNHALNS